jgi:hypothetical protein
MEFDVTAGLLMAVKNPLLLSCVFIKSLIFVLCCCMCLYCYQPLQIIAFLLLMILHEILMFSFICYCYQPLQIVTFLFPVILHAVLMF